MLSARSGVFMPFSIIIRLGIWSPDDNSIDASINKTLSILPGSARGIDRFR
jgi:hypothetical protein